MDLKISPGFSLPWTKSRLSHAVAEKGGRRLKARPRLEVLEPRLTSSTYVWTALGDGQTWNDPNNWARLGPSKPTQPPAVPTPYSDVIFPPIATLPAGSSTTNNFNFVYLFMPLNSITIEGAYTFTGNPVTIDQSLSLANPFTPNSGATTAIIQLAGLELQPGVVVSAASGSTLKLGTTAAPTSLQLLLEGGITKNGGGDLAIDITFERGSQVLAIVSLTALGTASTSVSSLPIGTSGIQAIYSGSVNDQSSVSSNYKQFVNPLPTTTTLSIMTQSLAHGRIEYVLVATVAPAGGNPPTSPTGVVVFRRNGRTLGKAKIAGGVAQLVLGRNHPNSKLKFQASFPGNSQFQASTSLTYSD